MPTFTLCGEYVVSQSVLGQFFEWLTTLGIEDCVRLDLNFRPGSRLDSTPPSPPADIWLDNVSNISATGLSLPSQDPLPLSCDALAPSTSSLFTNPSVGTPAPSSAINANGHDYATPAPATLDNAATAPPSSPAPRKALQKCPHCKERFTEKNLSQHLATHIKQSRVCGAFDNLKIAQNLWKGWVRVAKLLVRAENIFPCLKEKGVSPCDPMHGLKRL